MRREGRRFLRRDVHDPLPPIGWQIDLLVPGHLFQQPLHVRLLHEAEAYFDGDDAAAVLIAIEHGHPIAIIPDIGDLAMACLRSILLSLAISAAMPAIFATAQAEEGLYVPFFDASDRSIRRLGLRSD